MVMQEDTEIYPGSGKRRPYVQRGREVCIILHLSACTGANTSVVWSMGVLPHMGEVLHVSSIYSRVLPFIACGGIEPYTLTARLGPGGLAHYETSSRFDPTAWSFAQGNKA